MKRVIILALVLLVLGSAGAADIWVGTGQTYTDIKSAIAAAVNGDTVIVKDGTYTGANNKTLSLLGKEITVRSENGPANCIIDCESSANSTAFSMFYTGEGPDSIIMGFTITRAAGTAISCDNVSPTIQDCIITSNTSTNAGGTGIVFSFSSAIVKNCTFTNNTSEWGGAINIALSSPTIENCVFTGNTATRSDMGGGGIYCDAGSSPIIKNCLFANNSTSGDGGAIYCYRNCTADITNCTFVSNSASSEGGGIYCYSPLSYEVSSPTITNCIFTGNMNYAIYEGSATADPVVTYCHFYNNGTADYKDHDSWQWTGAADINYYIAEAHDNIDGNPLFVTGPLTDYYLSQTASGQASDSPCVNAGNDTASNLGLDDVTTRTDGVYDIGTVDIGYHHPDAPASLYELTASVVSGNGTVSPESGSFAADSIVGLTATPTGGYRVKQWTGTDNDALKTTANQVTMNSNKTVTVEFETIPAIIYVDDDGPGEPAEDGSLTNPFDAIQEAVDIVPVGGTVVVLDGTYSWTGNNQIDFGGKALTLKSENGPQNCIIDCQFGYQAFNLYNNETNDSVIQGFTITNGYAYYGGAICLNYASPTIKDCIITNNWAYGSMKGGGGIDCSSSSPLIVNCIFAKNKAYFGGGIDIHMSSSPTIINSIFIENDADNAGGGIYINNSSATIQNCRLTANTSSNIGGAIYSSSYSSYSVINCTITDNTAVSNGGGIHCYDSSPVITNSIFTNNNNNAIYESHSSSDPNVTYCSFYDNPNGDYYDNDTSTSYTGAVNINTNVPQALNNIDGNPLFATAGYWDNDGEDDFWVDGDYHLQSQAGRWDPNTTQWIKDAVTSPCIDAGEPNSDWKKELWPHGKRNNIGLYGNNPHASMSDSKVGSASDFDNDEIIDGNDLSVLGQLWLNENTALLPADISRNGNIDLTDFAYFANGWGQPVE
ncbi:MAG: right-handed parallel beta-helix repeat-containing protein [Planctomycetes bacterium]|nr:right-handed parallel beta-helix repeat-containing protein [Planctomycetota bacterium]